MLEAFLVVFHPMIRVILLICVGFALRRLNLLPEHAERMMSRLVTMLFLPSLLLHTNLLECRVDSLAANWALVLCGTCVCLFCIGLAWVLAPRFSQGNEYDEGVYRYALTFPNSGGVGTPLVLAMFGTAGLFQYTLFQFVPLILNYSWGVLQLQPQDRKSGPGDMIRRVFNPTLIGLMAGILLGALGIAERLPDVVLEMTD